MKLQLKKEPSTKEKKILIPDARLHVTQDMRLGISEQTGQPFYIMKLELVTDLNGMQAILGSLQSDGSIIVQVLDGTTQNQDEHKPE